MDTSERRAPISFQRKGEGTCSGVEQGVLYCDCASENTYYYLFTLVFAHLWYEGERKRAHRERTHRQWHLPKNL
jgi:hypothetical protein